MDVYILRDLLKSQPWLFFLSVLLLMLALEFPVFDIPLNLLDKKAEAIIGRPATPRSVAGAHRRTRRRVIRRHVALGTRVYTLPAGCTTVIRAGVLFHHCSGVYYRTYYEGNTVVYVVENP
jgi:hypothetical protein